MFNAKNIHNTATLHGLFCVLKSGVYHCIYGLQYRLLPFIGSRDKCSQYHCAMFLAERKVIAFFIYTTLILSQLCQEQTVSGTLRTTVTVFLRQQRDSLHRIRNSLSRGWKVLVTLSSSASPSMSTSSALAPNGSASSTSATGASSLPSKPPG